MRERYLTQLDKVTTTVGNQHTKALGFVTMQRNYHSRRAERIHRESAARFDAVTTEVSVSKITVGLSECTSFLHSVLMCSVDSYRCVPVVGAPCNPVCTVVVGQ